MKTKEDFLKEMETDNILSADEYTRSEYVSELLQFQQMICKLIAKNEYYDTMRAEEATFLFEKEARLKGLRAHPSVNSGAVALKKLQKEVAITMSGQNGENAVSKKLTFLNRPNTKIFSNVNVSDGEDETELDEIILTDRGIVILEVKNVRCDLTLTEDGRMVLAGNECYDKKPLGERMKTKRRLLKNLLENSLTEQNLEIPVFVDSYILFRTPKNRRIVVQDNYGQEKYCFLSNMNPILEHYDSFNVYSEEELSVLGDVLSTLEKNKKQFKSNFDYATFRDTLADALVVLRSEEPVAELEKTVVENAGPIKTVEKKATATGTAKAGPSPRQTVKKAIEWGSFAACLMIVGAAISTNAWDGFANFFRK